MSNKELFLKVVASMDKETDFEDFSHEYNDKIYGFIEVGNNKWEDDGKYSWKTEEAKFVEFDKNYNVIKQFEFGIMRQVSRTGSYYSDYYYGYYNIEPYEIVEIVIPEVIIAAHTEQKWNKLNISE